MRGFSLDRSPLARLACALLWPALLWACGSGDREALADARQELANAAYLDAVAAADTGLERTRDARTSWGLELVKLEAHARAGNSEQTKGQLAKLARLYPDRIPPTQYSATAGQLRSAGQGPAAIEVLDMGLKRHPGNPALERLIGEAGASDLDSAELEMLRSLGYID
jgi:hypothetical protein